MNKVLISSLCILLVSAQYPRAPSYYGVNNNNYYGGYNQRGYYQQPYYNNYYQNYPYNYNNYYNSYPQSNWGLGNDGNGNIRIGNDLAALYITCNGRGCPVRG